MSQSPAPNTPLVATSSADEVMPELNGIGTMPDSSVNFAAHEASREWILENVSQLVTLSRGEGAQIREEWDTIRRMAMMVRDENAAYQGNSEAYLPIYHRALETRVSAASRALFPSDSFLDGIPSNPLTPPAEAEVAKAWMKHQMSQEAKLRLQTKPFLRQLFNYGVSVMKCWWHKPPEAVRAGKTKNSQMMGQILADFSTETPWNDRGFRAQTRSVFSWYVWPKTINSLAEASLVFEDIQVSKSYAKAMVDAKRWLPEALDNLGGRTYESNLYMQQQLRNVNDGGSTAADSPSAGPLGEWGVVAECWVKMPVPDSLYTPDEVKGSPVPCMVVLLDGQPIEARRNPFWHQQPPYVYRVLHDSPDSFYSVGMGRAASSIQYLANDFVNQTNDNGTYALNPIVKANPNLLAKPLEALSPGKVIYQIDSGAIEFDRPPVEQLQYGMQLTQQQIGFMNDFSGAPAQLQGTSSKGTSKTATGAQILEGNVKGEIQDLVEEIEQATLEPLMQMCWTLGQQYETQDRWLAITGGQKVQFKREMFQSRYAWQWVASSQAINRQARAQGTMQFLQTAAQLMPFLQMQGKVLNPIPALRALYEDGLGQRNFDQVITQMPMQPMMPGQLPMQGGPPGIPQPQQMQSAAVQGAGSGEMAPGEGEALAEVRQGANADAAMQGAGFDFGGE